MATYDFKGKTIVVTGAGAGIGKAVTEKLLGYGAQVIAVSLVKAELDTLVKENPGVRAIQADLRDWEGTKKALQGLGKVHGLVNNAGVALVSSFLDIKESEFDLTFSVNVKAIINVSQIVAKSMIENEIKGSIVNLSSIAALTSWSHAGVYCASKGAVTQLTKVMALELGPKGIRVNSVNPTVVKTELSRFIWTSEAGMAKMGERTPMGTFPTPEDVADATSLSYAGVYCASKGAVQQLTKVMALELGPKGIRVNSVNPTVVKTELSKFIWSSDAIMAKLGERTPVGSFPKPENVADAITFLLSDQASHISGIPMPIDGGYMAT